MHGPHLVPTGGPRAAKQNDTALVSLWRGGQASRTGRIDRAGSLQASSIVRKETSARTAGAHIWVGGGELRSRTTSDPSGLSAFLFSVSADCDLQVRQLGPPSPALHSPEGTETR